MEMTHLNRWIWGPNPAQSHNGFPINLTQRQREVLLLLCEGLPNKVIGRRLGLADATVKCHVASVLRCLNVATRLEAASVAYRLGLVRPCEAALPRRPDRDDPPPMSMGFAGAAIAA